MIKIDIRVEGKNILIDSVEILAIENDNSTEEVRFVIDRYQNGEDISKLYGFIVYSNALGCRFEALETNISDDFVYAHWIITRAVTAVNGRFDFCLTFISSQNYNDISGNTKVWATNIAHSRILSSLVGEDYAVPVEPIIIQIESIATKITSIERDSKENADRSKNEADRAAAEASRVESIIDSLIDMIDEINGESVSYIDSIDEINGEVI